MAVYQPSACFNRIDDCFWRSRMFSEEAAFSLGLVASTLDEPYKSQVADMQAQLMKAERAVYDVQQVRFNADQTCLNCVNSSRHCTPQAQAHVLSAVLLQHRTS